MSKKILFVVLDGLGDRPLKELGNKTPLEAAFTPNLDFLAKEGVCGLAEVFFRGEFPSSDEGHLTLFGYNPKVLKIGRGVFEAVGAGVKLRKEDVALRGNFATVGKNFKILDRRAGRIKETQPLIDALGGIKIKGVKIIIKKGVEHRFVLVLRGRGLSENVSGNDPQKIGVKAPLVFATRPTKSAKRTAEILNEFLKKSWEILKNHPLAKSRIKQGKLPANFVLLRGAGKLKKVKSFKEKYNLRSCFVAGGVLYKGVAKFLGMKEIKVKGATGALDTNLKAMFKGALRGLKKFDFCYVHVKGCDIFGHDGDFLGKKKFIEKIDKNFRIFLNLKDTIIVVTCDHRTPCRLKEHSPDPVPVLVWGKGKDEVRKFSERECAKGHLGKFAGVDLMKKIV